MKLGFYIFIYLLMGFGFFLEVKSQQVLCQGSLKNYSVDIDENNGAGTIGSTYTWMIEEDYFSGEIIYGSSQNQIQIDWGNTPNGTYTLTVTESNGNGCPVSRSIDIVVNGGEMIEIGDFYLCPGDEVVVDAPFGWSTYEWYDGLGELISNDFSHSIDTPGSYQIIVSDGECSHLVEFEVLETALPEIIIETNDDDQIIVNVSGGNPPYLYQLEKMNGLIIVPFQSSNIFNNISSGVYRVVVQSEDGGCLSIEIVLLLKIPNVITPNNDRVNDIWHLDELMEFPGAIVKVYDRYGKLLTVLNKGNNFSWDGRYMGKPVPSDTYWYEIDFPDLPRKTGWLLVKNRN